MAATNKKEQIEKLDSIPDELKAIPRWVCYDNKKLPKQSKCPSQNASTRNPTTWSSYEEAVKAYNKNRKALCGVGLVLSADNDIICIDLDHIITKADDGESSVNQLDAERIVKAASKAGTYIEMSPSGNGIHIWLRGKADDTTAQSNDKGNIEVFTGSSARYITFTGRGRGELKEAQEVLDVALAAIHTRRSITTSHEATEVPVSSTEENYFADSSALSVGLNDYQHNQEDVLRAITAWPLTGSYTNNAGVTSEVGLNSEDGFKRFTRTVAACYFEAPGREQQEIKHAWDARCKSGAGYDASDNRKEFKRFLKEYREGKSNTPPNYLFAVVRQHGWGGVTQNPGNTDYDWPAPTPLPDEMPDVPKLDMRMLPATIRKYVDDISHRIQSPPEFAAVCSITMIGSLIGTQLGIRPKARDNWTVVPNLWAAIIGLPSSMKSPSVGETIRPVKRLEADAGKHYKAELLKWEVQAQMQKAQNDANKKSMTKLFHQLNNEKNLNKAQGFQQQIDGLVAGNVPIPEKPVPQRFFASDITVEKLGMLLNQNPHGMLVLRDELSGLLRIFDDERKGDRAFYLEAWNGTGSHHCDRVTRDDLFIEHACVSIMGGIQPDPLRRYLSHSEDNDGMVQRFQMAVWPDLSQDWQHVDEYPDKAVKDAIFDLCGRLAELNTNALGKQDEFDAIPHVRFTDAAQSLFDDWYKKLMCRIRTQSLHPAVSAHLGKYPSLIASLALIFWLVEEVPDDYETNKTWSTRDVGTDPLHRAIAWAMFLEPHAMRIYAQKMTPDMATAHALLEKLKSGKLGSPFTERDVYRKGWVGLDKHSTRGALGVLKDFDYIHTVKTKKGVNTVYENHVNPKA